MMESLSYFVYHQISTTGITHLLKQLIVVHVETNKKLLSDIEAMEVGSILLAV